MTPQERSEMVIGLRQRAMQLCAQTGHRHSCTCKALGDEVRAIEGQSQAEQIALWSAFAKRVELRFPFRVDVIIEATERHSDRAQMRVRLHVRERDTREPITVDSRRPCALWTTDEAATDMLFDLLEVALRHETYESVWLDGKLVNEMHKAPT